MFDFFNIDLVLDSVNWLTYTASFGAAFLLTLILVPVMKWVAFKVGAIDKPSKIKIHKKDMPRLGGVAIFISFVLLVLFDLIWGHRIIGEHIELKNVLGLLLGCLIIVGVGVVDDIKSIKPWQKFLGQTVAALVVVLSGIGIDSITNPFGGQIDLDILKISISFGSSIFWIIILADIFSLIWILGMVNTVNFLDGMDGLAAGVGIIASVVLFLLSLNPTVNQPEVAYLSVIFAGALLGFLFFNFHPAKIFAGDSGSMLIGFIIATLAIINGAKVATALLIMGFPILDVLWTIIRRIAHKKSLLKGDKEHFHHRLLNLGLSQRQVVFIIYFFVVCFGFLGFVLHGGKEKLIALIILSGVMLFSMFLIIRLLKVRR